MSARGGGTGTLLAVAAAELLKLADAVLGKGFQQRPAAWLASMLTWCLAIDTLGKVGWMEVEGDQVRVIIDWA